MEHIREQSLIVNQRACARCGVDFDESALSFGEDGLLVCPACTTPERPAGPRIPLLGGIACAVAIVPFFIHYRVTNSSTIEIDGMTASEDISSFDYVAVPFGALAVLLGLAALGLGAARRNWTGLAAGALALLIGAFHVWTGLRP